MFYLSSHNRKHPNQTRPIIKYKRSKGDALGFAQVAEKRQHNEGI
jgi:hypothetical protein